MRFLLLCILLFSGSGLMAQDISVYILIRDTADVPIDGVRVSKRGDDDGAGLVSDRKGRVRGTMLLTRGDTLDIIKDGYRPVFLVVDSSHDTASDLREELTLERTPYDLEGIIIQGRAMQVYGEKRRHVADFQVLDRGYLILTEKGKHKEGSILMELDENFQEVWKLHVPGKPKEIYRDFRGHSHLVCEDTLYKLDRSIPGLMPSSLMEFRRTTMPIVDTMGHHFFFSNYSDIYPAFDYIDFNAVDSTYSMVGHVVDTMMMELYRAEYKWANVRDKLWAIHKEAETGVDKEIWIGAAFFTQSFYYRSLYAPMYKVNDTMMFFDHYVDKLFKYLPSDGLVDSLSIDYHRAAPKGEWAGTLLQDGISEKVYTYFQDGGWVYLTEIDMNSGKLGKPYRLQYEYPERMKVVSGRVYYIYRPFESPQKRYLYSEKL